MDLTRQCLQGNFKSCAGFDNVRLIHGMVSCPGGLFLMYVSPMPPLYANSQPAPTRSLRDTH